MRLRKSAVISPALILSAGLFCPVLPAQSSPSVSTAQPLRVYSREVIVDINVTDAKGIPVHGLTRDKFTVLEDGKPITPRGFREHRSDQEQADSPAPAAIPLPPNTFTNAGAPETIRPLNILLLDSLDTPVTTQSIVQKRLTEFVEKMAPGTRVAVFSLSAAGQLSMLQGFTSDPELLKKALKSHKLDLQIPALEDSGQDPNVDVSPDMNQTPVTTRKQPAIKSMQPQQVKADQNVECGHAAARGQYTLAAITQIARYLSGLPGRKNLIWYSGAFPLAMKDRDGGYCYDFNEDLRNLDDLLGHSHVSVFPVDSRAMDLLAKNDPTSRPVRQQAAEDRTMEAIAEYTGGKAFYTTNDLATAAAQAIDTGANYYTITYSPTNQVNDTRLRTISVQVDQPDLTLLYKHGYHAVPPNTMVTTGKPIEKATPIQSAMMAGSLQPTEILFHVSVASGPITDALLPPGNTPDPRAMKPPYRHFTLSYLIDLNGIEFEQAADGNFHGQFEYAVDVYDPSDGKLLNSSDMAAKPALPPAVYQSMLNSGAKVRQEIGVPAKGDYILRIGVHDITTGRVGAIEFPVAAIAPAGNVAAAPAPQAAIP